MKISILILALYIVFLGAAWATWITISQHNLGVLPIVVGLVAITVELFTHWQPWKS